MLGLVPGQIGGMESYARNLARMLPALDHRHRYVAAIGEEARGIATAADGSLVEWVADPERLRWPRRVRPLRTLLQSAALARRLRDWSPDVLHCLLMFPKPPWGASNMVVTVHDLNFELFPDLWSPVDRHAMRLACRLAVRMARAVITVSEFSRRTLGERYGTSADWVHVIPHGVRHDVFSPGEPPEAGAKLRRELDLPDQWLLYPANTWPHKNHVRLLEALARLRDADRLRPGLLLTGSPKGAHAEVLGAVARRGLDRQVRWLGYVDQARLVALYRAATALVFPSLHEGFGMPVLEAMACGCPVVCSQTTGTGETAGDAALTFGPTEVGGIAEAIRAVLASEPRRRDLARRGLERAAQFTWERAGRETLAVYDEVIARGRAGGTPHR
jgi:glycosyltransferase involved in cell wall biosynthesis